MPSPMDGARIKTGGFGTPCSPCGTGRPRKPVAPPPKASPGALKHDRERRHSSDAVVETAEFQIPIQCPVSPSKGEYWRPPKIVRTAEAAEVRASIYGDNATLLEAQRLGHKIPSFLSPAWQFYKMTTPIFSMSLDGALDGAERMRALYENIGLLAALLLTISAAFLLETVPDNVTKFVKHIFIVSQCMGALSLFFCTTNCVFYVVVLNGLHNTEQFDHWRAICGPTVLFSPLWLLEIGSLCLFVGLYLRVLIVTNQQMTHVHPESMSPLRVPHSGCRRHRGS